MTGPMRGESTQLGDYRLEGELGRGAFGVVHAAVHRSTGAPVAIKELTAGAPDAWEAEVRALARLDHPGILRILDVGQLGMDGERRPWFAMERVDGGSLQDRLGQRDWATVRRWLLEVLDALGHAHAVGLVHRDIKPTNVLLRRDRALLADFGLAMTLDAVHARRAGTPGFMAPEQGRGDWRRFGPWTDLYAVGGLCLALLGAVEGPEDRGTVQAPGGLAGWLARTLAPEPADRWVCAADAAEALRSLGDAVELSIGAVGAPLPEATWETGLGEVVAVQALPETPCPRSVAPFPQPWVRRDPELGERGAVALFGLRDPALVGREALQEALGARLAAVHRGQGPRVVGLRGGSGVGKSRLARWVVRRARSSGAAHGWVVRHGAEPGERALDRTVRGWLRADGVHDVVAHGEGLDLPPGPEVWRRAGRFLAAERTPDRRAHLGALLRALTEDRPLVVVVDDAQWAAETLDALVPVLPERVLLVLTAQDEATDADTRARLETVCDDWLEVGPLTPGDLHGLLGASLPLGAELAATLVARTGGNPLHALQLLHDARDRGLLEQRAHGGLGLRAGAEAALPTDLAVLWQERVTRAVPEEALPALRVAALLHPEIGDGPWREACAALGILVPDGLVGRLADRRLGERDLVRPDTWRLAHGMVAEAVLRGVAPAERARLNRAVAAVVSDPFAQAHHWIAGGEPARVPALLREPSRQATERADKHGVARCVALLDRVVAAGVEIAPTDVLRRDLLRAHLHQLDGERSEARRLGGVVEHRARALGDFRSLSLSLSLQGMCARADGAFERAEALFEEAVVHGQADGDRGRINLHVHLAHLYLAWGRPDRAQGALDAARSLPDGRPEDRVAIHHAACLLAVSTGQLERAREEGEQTLALARTHDLPVLEGQAHNRLGVVAHFDGRLDDAARHYEASRTISAASGFDTQAPDVNLAVVDVDRERFDAALERLDRLLEAPGLTRGTVLNAEAARLVALVAREDWLAVDQALERLGRRRSVGALGIGPERLLGVAAGRAEAAGQGRRAAQARSLIGR